MKKIIAMLLLATTGCAPGFSQKDVEYVYVQPTPTPAITMEEDIASLVADENAYRLGLGQTLLSEGLSCTLYTVTGGERIQATSGTHLTLTGISQVATWLFKGMFNQADESVNTGLNIMPNALQAMYTNMFLVRCQGSIVITSTGYYQFDLASDDGSVFYLDGSKVVDNDNNHGVTNVTGSKYMRRGVHTFRLDFAQTGGGNQALILMMNGTLLDPVMYVH